MAWQFFSNGCRRCLACGGLALLVLLPSACGTSRGANRSWLVKPHQREYLADRIMRPETSSQEATADQHVLTTREGAIGGGGTVGGGCGCN